MLTVDWALLTQWWVSQTTPHVAKTKPAVILDKEHCICSKKWGHTEYTASQKCPTPSSINSCVNSQQIFTILSLEDSLENLRFSGKFYRKFSRVCQWKNFENPLRTDRVINQEWWTTVLFLRTQCTYQITIYIASK